MHATLRLIGFDEGGVARSRGTDNLRLVCLVEGGGGKVAIWGNSESRSNIDQVLAAGLPCTIECDCIQPEAWARKYGHAYWVPQGYALVVAK